MTTLHNPGGRLRQRQARALVARQPAREERAPGAQVRAPRTRAAWRACREQHVRAPDVRLHLRRIASHCIAAPVVRCILDHHDVEKYEDENHYFNAKTPKHE